MKAKIKKEKRKRRHKRVRAKINGTAKIPRLCVFRSNKHIYAQLIDDEKGKTLVQASDLEIKTMNNEQRTMNNKKENKKKIKNIEKTSQEKLQGKKLIAHQVGELIAQKAKEKKIKEVKFDRGGYKYHGRVKALAEGARDNDLQF